MTAKTKITPLRGILLCINAMIGAGLFINAKPLTMMAGSFGFLGYVCASVILLPLIFCIAELAALHPVAGGLYVYGKTYVGSWAGFVSAWAYFIGKSTSVAILLHKFIEFFYVRVEALQAFPLVAIDCSALLFLVLLNSIGVGVGGKVQYFFSLLKAIPITFAFVVGFFYFDLNVFQDSLAFQDVLSIIPISIFPLLGFEIICSIGNMIDDAQKNIKRVIFTAFVLVAFVDVAFQATVFGVLGSDLALSNEPIFTLGLKALFRWPIIASFVNATVFASIIGACFSIMTSNCWNLHTIARFGHLPGTSFLMRINQYNVPWVSLIVEALIGCAVLCITAEQVSLQNMSVLAQVISYIISSLAAWYAVRSGALKKLHWMVPLLALGSCALVAGICLQRMMIFGCSLPFMFLGLIGFVAAVFKKIKVCA